MSSLLEYEPIKAFVDTVGRDIEEYFGKDDACIVYLRPDGVFYARGIYEWLSPRKKNLVITTMEEDGADLDRNLVRGRKVLIVDNDVVTGKAYKRSMEVLRAHKKELDIKDIKFASFFDRVGLADFYVKKYSSEEIWRLEEMDALDLKIIKLLAQNGRYSLSFIAEKTHLSSVAIKNRIDHLLKEKIVKIQGSLDIGRFYGFTAHIHIEAEPKNILVLAEHLEKLQEVFQMVRLIGGAKLVACVLARNFEDVDTFIAKEIRSFPGVKNVEVEIGELPLLPKTIPPKF